MPLTLRGGRHLSSRGDGCRTRQGLSDAHVREAGRPRALCDHGGGQERFATAFVSDRRRVSVDGRATRPRGSLGLAWSAERHGASRAVWRQIGAVPAAEPCRAVRSRSEIVRPMKQAKPCDASQALLSQLDPAEPCRCPRGEPAPAEPAIPCEALERPVGPAEPLRSCGGVRDGCWLAGALAPCQRREAVTAAAASRALSARRGSAGCRSAPPAPERCRPVGAPPADHRWSTRRHVATSARRHVGTSPRWRAA
jgi:hypothetical protein